MEFDPHKLKQTTLARVPENQAFVVCRGDRVTYIKDLANCIESLKPEEFKHHVNPQGTNHFALWINDVLHNPLLARDLNYEANLVDQKHYVKTIRDHVRWLESV